MNELSDHKSIGENLAPEEEQRLVDLGALGWPPEDIARSINANVEQFTQEYNDPNSRVAVLIARGLLQKRALLEIGSWMRLSAETFRRRHNSTKYNETVRLK